jgi:hypothetical protein
VALELRFVIEVEGSNMNIAVHASRKDSHGHLDPPGMDPRHIDLRPVRAGCSR